MSQASHETPPSSPAGLLVGSVIAGKYRIDGVLGAGGMGVVLSATNLDLDAPVAIKIMRDEFADNEEVVARMLQEARSAAKMHGVHVVRVLDVARLETGTPYIVMECLQGADLATLLNERGALPIHEAVTYVLQACEGLIEAHALGIVHRDLKPENLFLAATVDGPVLKILDFGISKDTAGSISTLTNAGCAVGSPYYMSPEQMQALPQIDARADIWSLGTVLFELLTGKCPFQGESMQVVCVNVLNAPTPSLQDFSPHAPEALDAIVLRCLEKEPAARFESAAELASALRDFMSTDLEVSDHSLRVASGISLVPKPQAAREEAPRQAVRSSPTLPSVVITGNFSARKHAPRVAPRAATGKRRFWQAAAIGLTLGLCAGAFAWQKHLIFGKPQPSLARPSAPPNPSTQAIAVTPSVRPLDSMVVTTQARDPAQEPTQDQAQDSAPVRRRAEPARRPAPPRAHARAPGNARTSLSTQLDALAASPKLAPSAAPAPTAQSPASSATAAPSAVLDDLQSSNTSGRPAPVNAWDANNFGGRY
ncbi:MAG TPA: protein kinase [Polyangiaceae bacterium]|nr:protein kinase [Polyangiaceae bacterium]